MDELIAKLEHHVFSRKGLLHFAYDYHSGTWVATREYKDKTFVTTLKVEGEGQPSLEQAAQALWEKLSNESRN